MKRPFRFLLAVLVGCILTVFLAVSLAFAYVLVRLPGTAHLPAECAIVFGAAVHPSYDEQGRVVADSEAGPGILRRVGTAVTLYKQGLIKRLFLSGGKGEGMRRSEAAVMKQVALDGGVRLADIVTEDQSSNTRENLQNSRPLVSACTSVVAISDRYHLARIEFLAWQIGWHLPTYPASTSPNFSFESESIAREVAGILFYAFY